MGCLTRTDVCRRAVRPTVAARSEYNRLIAGQPTASTGLKRSATVTRWLFRAGRL